MIMFLQQLDLDGIFSQQIIDVFGITLSQQKLIFLLGQLPIGVFLLAPSENVW
jgi:hypothetical protein